MDTLEATAIDSLALPNAILAYFEALIRDQEERLDSLTRWLMGVDHHARRHQNSARSWALRAKSPSPTPFRMLRSLCQTIRALSYSGLILLFDEVDRMASVGGKAEKLATDNLREVIDRCRDELPGVMFVYAAPPQFINDIVPRYPALPAAPACRPAISRAPTISARKSAWTSSTLDENDLMPAFGEKLIPIYEMAYDVELNKKTQHANAAIHGQRDTRRLPRHQPPAPFRQAFVAEWRVNTRVRQHALGRPKPSPSSAARSTN